jgi:hypothetical protein
VEGWEGRFAAAERYLRKPREKHAQVEYSHTAVPDAGRKHSLVFWNSMQARKGDAAVTVDLRYYHDDDASMQLDKAKPLMELSAIALILGTVISRKRESDWPGEYR